MSPLNRFIKDSVSLIKAPENWCKNATAQNKNDTMVFVTSPEAHKFCSIGCIQRTLVKDPSRRYEFLTTRELMDEYAIDRGFEHVAQFNDACNTTHAAVIEMFNSFIKE